MAAGSVGTPATVKVLDRTANSLVPCHRTGMGVVTAGSAPSGASWVRAGGQVTVPGPAVSTWTAGEPAAAARTEGAKTGPAGPPVPVAWGATAAAPDASALTVAAPSAGTEMKTGGSVDPVVTAIMMIALVMLVLAVPEVCEVLAAVPVRARMRPSVPAAAPAPAAAPRNWVVAPSVAVRTA